MEYREIVSVTGLSGLYQLLTTKSDGAIVRNIDDKTTKFISARQHNVTPLESIEVYTIGENVRLHNVFQKMEEHESTIPLADHRTASKAGITSYFKSVFPEFDEERVYVSDMKKMLKWYELLKANQLLKFEAEVVEEVPAEEAAPVASAEEAAPATEEKPAKKAKAKKAEPTDAAAEGEEKPAKKAAKKKKTEE
jgi:hypothetical protein